MSDEDTIRTRDLIKEKIEEFEKRTDLKLQALTAELQKSESNYPTREQLDTQMKKFVTRNEVLAVLMIAEAVTLLIVAEYLRR